jgi:Immunoglobulin domain
MKSTRLFFALAISASICSATAQTPHLVPLTTFGPNGDGSLRPGDKSYLTTSGTERGMAYNPVTGHLLIVNRNDLAVYILDGDTGADISVLDMSGLVTGGNTSFKINMIGVADDGAIYVGNLSNNSYPPQYNLYRWDSEIGSQQLIFNGSLSDVSNGNAINSAGYQRYGDSIAVRGAGTSTQILVPSRGTNVTIFTPDSTLATWNPTSLRSDGPIGGMGYGIAFGPGNTFYATGGANSSGPLIRFAFNLGDGTNGTATTLQSFNRTVFPGTVSALGINVASNLLVGLDTIPDADLVRLYDISTPANAPGFLDRSSFATANDNSVFAGAVAFGTNGVIYLLDANNGLMAYTLVSSTTPVAPYIFLQPTSQQVRLSSNATFTASADGTLPLSYQWWFNDTNALTGASNSSLTLTNVQVSNIGQYTLIVTNAGGAVTSSVAALLVATNSPGVLANYEPFDYSPDQLLTTANPSYVLNGSGNDTLVATGGLTVPGLAQSIGNSITNGGSGAAVRLPLGTNINSGSLYYSVIMRIDSVGSAFNSVSSLIASFANSTNTGFQFARLIPRTNTVAGQFNLGVYKTTSAPIVWAANTFVEGQTIFIVCRYNFNVTSASDDTVDMWINPDPSSFGAVSPPAPTLSTVASGADIPNIDQFAFRQNTAANTPAAITWDELRVGTGWDVVTPPAPPAAPSLSITLSSASVIVAWPTNNSAGFSLQSEAGFTDPDGWTPVGTLPVINGTNYTVTVGHSGSQKLFRLIK